MFMYINYFTRYISGSFLHRRFYSNRKSSSNHYDALGVDSNASVKEIKTAFYSLSKKYHPDVNRDDVNAATKFTRISNAYDILGDPIKRREYDNELSSKFATSDPYVTYAQRARAHRPSAWRSASASNHFHRGFQENANGFGNSRSTNYGRSDRSQYDAGFGGYRAPSQEDYDEFFRAHYGDFKTWQQMKTEAEEKDHPEQEEEEEENQQQEKTYRTALSKLVLFSIWFSFGLVAFLTSNLFQEMYLQQSTEEFSSRSVTVSKSSRRSLSKF